MTRKKWNNVGSAPAGAKFIRWLSVLHFGRLVFFPFSLSGVRRDTCWAHVRLISTYNRWERQTLITPKKKKLICFLFGRTFAHVCLTLMKLLGSWGTLSDLFKMATCYLITLVVFSWFVGIAWMLPQFKLHFIFTAPCEKWKVIDSRFLHSAWN